MHAGQHLLSAVVEQVAGVDTLSWELHPQQPDTTTGDNVTINLLVPSLTPSKLQLRSSVMPTLELRALQSWI